MYTKKLFNIPVFENNKDESKSFFQNNGFFIVDKIFDESECNNAILESKNFENYKVSMVFDRSDFNVKYGSGKFFENLGDNMILDEIELEIELFKS